MDQQLNIAEAKARLSELIDLALAGGEVVIARAGKPVVRLVPAVQVAPARSGFFGVLSHLGPVPDEALTTEPADSDFDFAAEDDGASAMRFAAELDRSVFRHTD
ncbi:MAG: type II toxin-antitoxin system prevent-host-death family antitoxin [Hyphomonadaceae bacterium]|nr:type II toxin-antitoxin system prevent-host-death family antitoxin [Hyphomonadaceae bacterium]